MSNSLANQLEAIAQRNRIIAIDTGLGTDALLLTDIDGVDVLSRCFLYTIHFITQRADADVRSLLGAPVTLWLSNHDETSRRPINGLIRRIVEEDETLRGFATYRAEVVPHLWFLDCSADCRIFQDQTVPDIVATMLRDNGVTAFEFRLLKDNYPKLTYCVQYRETALAFVSRLLEDAGIFFYHEHHSNRHTLVIVDANSMASTLEPQQVRHAPRPDLGDVWSLRTETAFRPGRWALTDYDFEAPSKLMHKHVKTLVPVESMTQREIFEFPGGYTDQTVGDWLIRLRMEAEEAQHVRVRGFSSLAKLDPGHRMQVAGDTPESSRDARSYLLTEVRHCAREHSYFNSSEVSEYRNEFLVIPQATPFRPPRITPKPVVHGPQTATVVSPQTGDPIHTDMYGRIKVHFHWDRRGDRSKGNTSCWLRVSQVNAGSGAGSISIPHAGHEVVVAFLEGDPDRPLVVGRLHNAEKLPPLVLPRDKHKTEIRDHGNNKLIMHGKPGQEHLSLVTPRSLNLVAMRPPARSLSANAAQEFGDIDNWQDSTGLDEVKRIFDALTQFEAGTQRTAQVTPPAGTVTYVPTDGNPAGPTLQGKGTLDDTGALGIDINSFTDGRSNVVTLGNNNTWCYGGYNTWVHGWVNSKYCSGQYQEIFKENLQMVWGNNNQQTFGSNEQTTEGNNTQLTLLLSEQMVFGGSLTINMPYQMIINVGKQTTVSAADETNLSLSSDTICGEWSVTSSSTGSIKCAGMLSVLAPMVSWIGSACNFLGATQLTMTGGTSRIDMETGSLTIESGVVTVNGVVLKLG